MVTKQAPIRFAVAPGQIIRDELTARGWSQGKLAATMGRPYQTVNEIVNGRKAITPDTAIDLGIAFKTSAVYWMNLEGAYQLYKAYQRRKARTASVERRVVGKTSVIGKGTSKRKSRDSDATSAGEELPTKRTKIRSK